MLCYTDISAQLLHYTRMSEGEDTPGSWLQTHLSNMARSYNLTHIVFINPMSMKSNKSPSYL